MIEFIANIASTVVPLIIYGSIGIFVAWKFHLTQENMKFFNSICFYVLMTCTMFKTAYNLNIESGGIGLAIILWCAFNVVLVVVSIIVGKKFEDPRRGGAVSACLFKGNFTLVGIPIAQGLLSETGFTYFAILDIIATAFCNIAVVVAVSAFSNKGQKLNILKLLKDIILNPIIFSTMLGFICRFIPGGMPDILMVPIKGFASATTPICMLLVGFSIYLSKGVKNLKIDVAIGLTKILLCPIILTAVAYFAGLRGPVLGAIYVTQAVPIAMNTGIIVDSMDCEGSLAHEVSFTTTAACMVTFFFAGIVLSMLGWT